MIRLAICYFIFVIRPRLNFAICIRPEVPRTRFAPVKKCSDLFLLRSDAYVIEDFKPVLAKGVKAAPTIDLDSKKYKMVSQLERCSP